MPESPAEQYRKIQIGTASPVQLVVLLYDGVLQYLERSAVCMENGDMDGCARWCDRVNAIVQELLGVLDFDIGGEVAQQLASIYTMTMRETLKAQIRRDPGIFRRLGGVYTEIKGGWIELAKRPAAV
jgi:flagellar secretion chaperone FliS